MSEEEYVVQAHAVHCLWLTWGAPCAYGLCPGGRLLETTEIMAALWLFGTCVQSQNEHFKQHTSAWMASGPPTTIVGDVPSGLEGWHHLKKMRAPLSYSIFQDVSFRLECRLQIEMGRLDGDWAGKMPVEGWDGPKRLDWDGQVEIGKMPDARCKVADQMDGQDEIKKWGGRWKPEDGTWCHPSNPAGSTVKFFEN